MSLLENFNGNDLKTFMNLATSGISEQIFCLRCGHDARFNLSWGTNAPSQVQIHCSNCFADPFAFEIHDPKALQYFAIKTPANEELRRSLIVKSFISEHPDSAKIATKRAGRVQFCQCCSNTIPEGSRPLTRSCTGMGGRYHHARHWSVYICEACRVKYAPEFTTTKLPKAEYKLSVLDETTKTWVELNHD